MSEGRGARSEDTKRRGRMREVKEQKRIVLWCSHEARLFKAPCSAEAAWPELIGVRPAREKDSTHVSRDTE